MSCRCAQSPSMGTAVTAEVKLWRRAAWAGAKPMPSLASASLATASNPEARTRMLRAEDVADCVLLAINLPDRAVVEQLVLRPR